MRSVALILGILALPVAAEESAVASEPFGIWRCDASMENGSSHISWFNFGRNGAQQWLTSSRAQPGGWTESFLWRKEDGRLRWPSRVDELYYRGYLSGRTIRGALFHDETYTNLAGDFLCGRETEVPKTGDDSDSTGLDALPAVSEARRAKPRPKPTPHRMVSPGYPEQALLQEVEGRVVVCFDVDSAGRVAEPVIMESTNVMFNEPVLKAVARSLYHPARQEGQAVPSHSCRIYKFWLH